MYKGKKIALVVPAYNEERLIVPTLTHVPRLVDKIYAVNDGSTDKTKAVIKRLARKDKRIILVDHGKNKGLGQAIITGYLRSAEDKNFITVVVGGDYQMDLSEVKKFLDPIIAGKADFTKGNRFLYSKRIREDMPKTRIFGNASLSFLTKLATGYWKIFDSNDGYTAIKTEFIPLVDWDTATKGYGYNGDWMAMFNLLNMRIMDIPRRPIYLKGERQSQIKVGRYTARVLPRLIYRFLWRLKEKYILQDFHPLILFYVLSFILIPLGILYGLLIIYSKLLFNVVTGSTTIFTALLLIIGFQSLFFAMFFDMEDNRSLCVRKK